MFFRSVKSVDWVGFQFLAHFYIQPSNHNCFWSISHTKLSIQRNIITKALKMNMPQIRSCARLQEVSFLLVSLSGCCTGCHTGCLQAYSLLYRLSYRPASCYTRHPTGCHTGLKAVGGRGCTAIWAGYSHKHCQGRTPASSPVSPAE